MESLQSDLDRVQLESGQQEPAAAQQQVPDESESVSQQGESSDDEKGYESDPEKEVELMKLLEEKIAIHEQNLGLANEKTLNKIFKLLNLYIQHYKLDVMDELLAKVSVVCIAMGEGSVWFIKYIQMLGFCRWKQYRLREALELFLKQEKLVGDNSILCENIGHTYSSLGEYDKARESFQKGLQLLGPNGPPGREAGFLYGLGLATDRLGNTEEALPMLYKALDGYRKERIDPEGNPVDSSIHAKVQSSIGHLHEKLGDFEQAMKYFAEAVRVFRKCTGEAAVSPLTTTAMGNLGKLKLAVNDLEAAQPLLAGALEGEVNKDSFQVDDTFTMVNLVKELHTRPPTDGQALSLVQLHAKFAQYVDVLEKAIIRSEVFLETEKNGDVAALYKTIGEVLLLAGHNESAISVLSKAIGIFRKVTKMDCSGLIDGCNQLVTIAISMCEAASKVKGDGEAGPSSTGP